MYIIHTHTHNTYILSHLFEREQGWVYRRGWNKEGEGRNDLIILKSWKLKDNQGHVI